VLGIEVPEPGNKDYYVAINELAHAIRDTLELFQPAPRKTVHLAYATGDVEPVREEVRRELQSHGYGVTESDLEGSSLSLHLIGDEYRETAVAQLDRAKNSAHRGLPILVWIKPGTAKDPNQREWIASIERGHSSAEVLRTSVEELKTHILDILHRRDETPHPPVPSPKRGAVNVKGKAVNIEVTLTVHTPDGRQRIAFKLKKDIQDDGSSQWKIGFQIFERGKNSDPFDDPIVDLLVEVDSKLNDRAQAMAEKGMTPAQSAFACGPAADTAKNPNVSEAKKKAAIQAILTR
jgi:hypothetical protein